MIYGGAVNRRDVIDAVADRNDRVTVEIQRNVANSDERTVYIHINGITVVRMGHIKHTNLDVIFQEGLEK